MDDVVRSTTIVVVFSLLLLAGLTVVGYEVCRRIPATPEPTITAKKAEHELVMMARA